MTNCRTFISESTVEYLVHCMLQIFFFFSNESIVTYLKYCSNDKETYFWISVRLRKHILILLTTWKQNLKRRVLRCTLQTRIRNAPSQINIWLPSPTPINSALSYTKTWPHKRKKKNTSSLPIYIYISILNYRTYHLRCHLHQH